MQIDLDAALKALAHPTRREILWHVWDNNLSVGEITDRFEAAGPTISEHLRILREAQLVARTVEGTTHRYRANVDTVSEISSYLAAFRGEDSDPTVIALSQSTRPKAGSSPVWQTVVEIELSAPPTEVYRYWTERPHMRRWLWDEIDVEATEGGLFRMRSGDGEEMRGKFRHLSPGQFVSFTWTFTTGDDVPLPPGHNEVTIWLRQAGDGTALELRQLTTEADRAPMYDAIWSEMLARLVDAVTNANQ